MATVDVDSVTSPTRVPSIELSDHGASFLSSEQFSLMSARNLGYNESFSRVSMFLTTLSASTVALALVADASGFDDRFAVFALVLFPIVLFLGIATHARLVQISLEDVHLVAALNRLRRAYIDGAPEIRDYLTTGVSDDEVGVWTTYLLGRPSPRRHWHQVIVNAPTTLATLNAVIATTGIGALIRYLGAAGTVVVLSCVTTFVAVSTALFSLQLRAYRTAQQNQPRYPSQH